MKSQEKFSQKFCMEKNRKISPINLFKQAVDFEHEEITKKQITQAYSLDLSFLMIYSYALSHEKFEPKSLIFPN